LRVSCWSLFPRKRDVSAHDGGNAAAAAGFMWTLCVAAGRRLMLLPLQVFIMTAAAAAGSMWTPCMAAGHRLMLLPLQVFIMTAAAAAAGSMWTPCMAAGRRLLLWCRWETRASLCSGA
jgi:hypothetical protein